MVTTFKSDSALADTFRFLTPPQNYSINERGDLHLTALPLTDWWRTPEPVQINRRTGPCYALSIDGSRDFQCGVWLKGKFSSLYDQAALIVMAGDYDDPDVPWFKTGVELEAGKEWIK